MATIHWTYDEKVASTDDLYQGDILVRTPALDDLLGQHFAHFRDQKYLGFLVVTQTCDLVLRGDHCKAQHICLAAIRELSPLLPILVEQIAGTGVNGFYRADARSHAIEVLRKIINQNEQTKGMFYLHPGEVTTDGRRKIATPSVAMLRVTIAVRQQHYELLREARIGRLETEFRNKLGWLCGNLFSRIDTPDWDEATKKKGAALAQAKSLLESIEESCWVPSEWVDAAVEAGVQFNDLEQQAIRDLLERHAPPAPLEIALERIRAIARKLSAVEKSRQLRGTLMADDTLAQLYSDYLHEFVARWASVAIATLSDGRADATKIFQFVATTIAGRLRAAVEAGRTEDELKRELESFKLTATKQALTGLAKKITGGGFQPDAAALKALDAEPLLPIDILAAIMAESRRLLSAAEDVVRVPDLLDRLRSDPEFGKWFQTNSATFAGDDQ